MNGFYFNVRELRDSAAQLAKELLSDKERALSAFLDYSQHHLMLSVEHRKIDLLEIRRGCSPRDYHAFYIPIEALTSSHALADALTSKVVGDMIKAVLRSDRDQDWESARYAIWSFLDDVHCYDSQLSAVDIADEVFEDLESDETYSDEELFSAIEAVIDSSRATNIWIAPDVINTDVMEALKCQIEYEKVDQAA